MGIKDSWYPQLRVLGKGCWSGLVTQWSWAWGVGLGTTPRRDRTVALAVGSATSSVRAGFSSSTWGSLQGDVR